MFDISKDVAECQVDNLGNIELSYFPNSSKGRYYKALLMKYGCDIDYDCIELLGFHNQDNFSYQETSITATLSQLKQDDSLLDFYAIKASPSSIIYKYYRPYNKEELEWIRNLISPFRVCWPAIEFGVGFYNEYEYRDVYFYTEARHHSQICKTLGTGEIIVPKSCEEALIAHYGITIDCEYNIVKLKRYYHGYDLLMTDWTNIYGLSGCKKAYSDSEYAWALRL